MSSTIVIPLWNGAGVIDACLTALIALPNSDVEIIVVDNASGDGSADLVAQRFPQVTLIRNERNLGFGAACNIGLRQGRGDILVVLNQDTEVERGWLNGLEQALISGADVGIAGSKAFYADGAIQHAGATLDPQVGGRHFGHGEADRGQHDALRDVDFVSGVSLAMTRRALTVTNGFDEGFAVAYFEDVDLCYRVRAAGMRVLYTPESRLIHHEESRLADGAHGGIYPFQKNRLRLVLKHWSIDRLEQEFVPTETTWLAGQYSEEFITAVQRAYMANLLDVDELMRLRRQRFQPAVDDKARLIALLLNLRMHYPLQPALPAPLAGEQHARESRRLLHAAAQHSHVAGRPFTSSMPVVGPLIAWMRQRWNRVAAEWYVQGILEQQNDFNQALLLATEHLDTRNIRLTELLVEYLREHARETADLHARVQQLEQRLRATHTPDATQPDHGGHGR